VRVGNEQDRVIRAIVGRNEEEQSLILAGNVSERSYARMMRGRIEHLIDGAQVAGASSIRRLDPSSPQFSILVSCTGRRYVLKQRIEEEIEAVSSSLPEGSTITGFYSLGEIGPTALGGPLELHNQTVVVTTFAEMM
jgi:hypothetical protein